MECFTRKKFNEMDRLAVQEANIPDVAVDAEGWGGIM